MVCPITEATSRMAASVTAHWLGESTEWNILGEHGTPGQIRLVVSSNRYTGADKAPFFEIRNCFLFGPRLCCVLIMVVSLFASSVQENLGKLACIPGESTHAAHPIRPTSKPTGCAASEKFVTAFLAHYPRLRG